MDLKIKKMVEKIKESGLRDGCDPKSYTIGVLMNMIDSVVNKGYSPERLSAEIERLAMEG